MQLSRLRLKLAATAQRLAAVSALAAIQQLVQVSALAAVRTVAATSNPCLL